MIRFEINGRISWKDFEPALKRLGKIASKEFKKNGAISLAIVGKGITKKINKDYRGKNKSADILTFVFDDGPYLGEIILSPENARRRAKIMGWTLEQTLVFLIIHGILHIMGYTHDKNRDTSEMERKEKHLLKKLDL